MKYTNTPLVEVEKISLFRMISLLCLLVATSVKACPTCIGNLDIDTPPLFSKEYEKQYALHDDGKLDIPHGQESVDEIRS